MGEHKGRPSIFAVEDAETPTWVKSIARVFNPSQTADHALLLDAPLILADYKRLREAMKTMLDDMNNASPEEDIEYWLDTWKHWLKEMVE